MTPAPRASHRPKLTAALHPVSRRRTPAQHSRPPATTPARAGARRPHLPRPAELGQVTAARAATTTTNHRAGRRHHPPRLCSSHRTRPALGRIPLVSTPGGGARRPALAHWTLAVSAQTRRPAPTAPHVSDTPYWRHRGLTAREEERTFGTGHLRPRSG